MKNRVVRVLGIVCCSQLVFGSNARADWTAHLTGRYLPRAFSNHFDYGDHFDYLSPPAGIGLEYNYGPALARIDLTGSMGLGYMPKKNWAIVGEYFYSFGPRYALLTAYQINLTGLEPDIFVKPRIGLIASSRAAGTVLDVYTGFDVGFHWYSGAESKSKGANWVAYGLIGGFLLLAVVGSMIVTYQVAHY